MSFGANDDLVGVDIALEAGKFLNGLKRFVERHREELRNAIPFNFECPSADYFLVATEEKTFFAKHSTKAVEIAKEACKRCNADFKVDTLKFAGSDAANFSQRTLCDDYLWFSKGWRSLLLAHAERFARESESGFDKQSSRYCDRDCKNC